MYPFSVGRPTGEMPAPDEVSRERSWDWDDVVIGTSPTATTPRPAHRRSESKDAQEREPAAGSPTYRRKIPYPTTRALLERWEHGQHPFAHHERVRW